MSRCPSVPRRPQSQGLGRWTQLIWPESPFPFFLTREADALAQIADMLPQGTVLITGAMRLADPDDPAQSGVYNSIYVIDHSGSIAAVYDKVHLVPFGEYLPFEHILERHRAAGADASNAADFSPATGTGSSPFRALRSRCRSSVMRSSFPAR